MDSRSQNLTLATFRSFEKSVKRLHRVVIDTGIKAVVFTHLSSYLNRLLFKEPPESFTNNIRFINTFFLRTL